MCTLVHMVKNCSRVYGQQWKCCACSNVKLFSKVIILVYIFSSTEEGSYHSAFMLALQLNKLSNFFASLVAKKWIFIWVIVDIFMIPNQASCLFIYFGVLFFLFYEMSVQVLSHFAVWIVYLYMSSLYILYTDPLWYAVISSWNILTCYN